MFIKSARYYDALYSGKDYAEASARIEEFIQHHNPAAKTLLDVGCGTGLHLHHLRHRYQVAGLDLNPELLEVAQERCSTVRFFEADMADFNTGQRYDVITCLFSAIGYVKTLGRMRQAIACMARHLEPGGLLLVEPWFTPEQYWTGTITSNYVDESDLKIAWMYTSDLEDKVSILDINYLVGTPKEVSYFQERHEIGLFSHEEYQNAIRAVGLSASHDPAGLFSRGVYIGTDERAQTRDGGDGSASELRSDLRTE